MADETTSCASTDVVTLDDEMSRVSGDVFSACRDGDVSQLRSLVDGRSKDQVRTIVATPTNGASSLIMACRNGHAAVVSFLVSRCHADIHQVGSVTFDGEVWYCCCSLHLQSELCKASMLLLCLSVLKSHTGQLLSASSMTQEIR